MMTRTAQNMKKRVKSEMANLRSSGLLLGFLSMYGASMRPKMPMPGIVTPATIGWNMVNSSWRPRKYQGAFEGFGVKLKLAPARNGALTTAEKISRKALHARQAMNSPMSRWGQVCTLSVGVALTSWMEPALTTVSSRWVWPSGPLATGAGAVATADAAAAVAAAPVVAGVAAAPPPPPPPPLR